MMMDIFKHKSKNKKISLSNKWLFVFDICIVVGVFFAALCWRFPILRPGLYLSENRINIGSVKNGDFIQRKFHLVNLHPWSIQINGLKGGCGCIDPFPGRKFPFYVRPFESFVVNIGFDVIDFQKNGKFARNVSVTSADGGDVMLSLEGHVEK
jgi:hypothetical protein